MRDGRCVDRGRDSAELRVQVGDGRDGREQRRGVREEEHGQRACRPDAHSQIVARTLQALSSVEASADASVSSGAAWLARQATVRAHEQTKDRIHRPTLRVREPCVVSGRVACRARRDARTPPANVVEVCENALLDAEHLGDTLGGQRVAVPVASMEEEAQVDVRCRGLLWQNRKRAQSLHRMLWQD